MELSEFNIPEESLHKAVSERNNNGMYTNGLLDRRLNVDLEIKSDMIKVSTITKDRLETVHEDETKCSEPDSRVKNLIFITRLHCNCSSMYLIYSFALPA
jgi:hypothetical protein